MTNSFCDLPQSVAELLAEHARLTAAVAAIEKMLANVSYALNGAYPQPAPAAAKPKTTVKKASLKAPAKVASKKREPTANDFVLAFIKEHKTPTSGEINAAWKAAGRNRSADITLSLLTKAKKLKRTPIGKGIRGSRYTLST